MASANENTPGSAEAILPTVGMNGMQGFESVEVKGNRLDNLTEAHAQTRQILAYRARFSDTFSDAVLWCAASGAISRLALLLVQGGIVAPIYPLATLAIVVVVGGVVVRDTLARYPQLFPSVVLRGFYVCAGLLSTVI